MPNAFMPDALMPNALVLVSDAAGAPGLSTLLDAVDALAPRQLIVAMCDATLRRLPRAELEALAAAPAQVLLTPYEPHGEACTALLAAEWIDDDNELLVAVAGAGEVDLEAMAAHFRGRRCDAGLATRRRRREGDAPACQRQVRLDARGLVVEVAEKPTEGAAAPAGVFWFARGRDFVRAAQAMIRKNPNYGGHYDICPALNELVLENRAIGAYSAAAA